MSKQIVRTEHAPAPIGPYSQAVIANGFVFLSGQIALDPASGTIVPGDISAQTEQVMKNLSAVLSAAGTTFANVLKTTVFLHSMDDFSAMNTVYGRFFTENPPSRSTVANLNLPRGVLVEIELVATVSG